MKNLKITPGRFFVSLFVLSLVTLYILNKKHKARYQPIALDLDNVLAYTKKPAFNRGDSIEVYIHTTEKATAVLYHLTDKVEKTSLKFEIPISIQSNSCPPVNGCDWKK